MKRQQLGNPFCCLEFWAFLTYKKGAHKGAHSPRKTAIFCGNDAILEK